LITSQDGSTQLYQQTHLQHGSDRATVVLPQGNTMIVMDDQGLHSLDLAIDADAVIAHLAKQL